MNHISCLCKWAFIKIGHIHGCIIKSCAVYSKGHSEIKQPENRIADALFKERYDFQ